MFYLVNKNVFVHQKNYKKMILTSMYINGSVKILYLFFLKRVSVGLKKSLFALPQIKALKF